MKSRILPVWIVAAVILSFASPAFAQAPCTAEPAIGERPIDVVYVPNRQVHTISVIDVTPGSACRNQVIATIDFEGTPADNGSPHAVFIHPDGKRAFSINTNHSAVGVIDTRTNTAISEIPLGLLSGALSGAMSPDGSRVYVSNLIQGTISVVDTVNETVIGSPIPLMDPDFQLLDPFGNPVPIPATQMFPIGLEVNPVDPTELWATVLFPGSVVVIDIENDANVPEHYIHLPPALDPTLTFPDPNFGFGFIPVSAVDVNFDPVTGVANVIALGRVDVDFAGFPGFSMADAFFRFASPTPPDPILPIWQGDGTNGFSEVVVADTGHTWITRAGQLSLQNIPLPPFTRAVAVADGTGVFANPPSGLGLTDGESPIGIARSQAGDFVYVANFNSGTLSVFDVDSLVGPVAVIPVGVGPFTPYQQSIPALPTTPTVTLTAGACNSVLPSIVLGQIVSFDVTAETTTIDPTEDELTLDTTGLPAPTVMTPVLPIANPGDGSGTTTVMSSFSWQPVLASEAGAHIIDFQATGAFETTTCQVTITVALPDPPFFSEPANGQTFQVETDEALSFDVSAEANPGAGNVVLDLRDGPTSLPGTSMMTPELPTDGTSPAVTSTFDWTPVPGDEGSYTIYYTATDGFGRQVEHHVNIQVVEPGTEIPFDPYVVTKLKIDKRPGKGTFEFRGAFGLGAASDGIDPLTEEVTIELDGFSLTIPAGSFRLRGRHNFKFNGVIGGVRINAELKAPRGGGRRHRLWTFKFKGKDADLSSVANPVDTVLLIGDDIGEGPKRAKIKG